MSLKEDCYLESPFFKDERSISVKLGIVLKRFLKKNILSRRCHSITNSLPVPLYYNPAACDFVVMKIHGRNINDVELFVNGRPISSRCLALERNIVYLVCEKGPFEPWENILSFPGLYKISCVSLYPGFKASSEISDFCPLFSGNYKLKTMEGRIIKEFHFEQVENENIPEETDKRALEYILRSFNDFDGSRFKGTFLPAFDLTYKTYRLNSWIWISGIVIKLLCKVYQDTGVEKYHSLAIQCGEYILKNQISKGPNKGAFMVRWDIGVDSPIGIIPWLAPNDAAFLATHGLLSLYNLTHDESYLNSAFDVGHWILNQGMEPSGQLYVGFRLDRNEWDKSRLYVDAGFTAILFEALYNLTKEKKWKDALKIFIDFFIQKFYVDEGFFYKTWFDSGKMDRNIFARGQAWALDGLISAFSLFEDKKYLDVILKVARYLVKKQNSNGSWNYFLNFRLLGECAKATPIIAYHLLRIYEICFEEEILLSAQEALIWCRNHQIESNHKVKQARGGIHSFTYEGASSSMREVDTIFTYSVAYYLLALERLKHIQGEIE